MFVAIVNTHCFQIECTENNLSETLCTILSSNTGNPIKNDSILGDEMVVRWSEKQTDFSPRRVGT